MRSINFGPLAQSVEQRTFNPWVVGSIPTGPTQNKIKKHFKILKGKKTFLSSLLRNYIAIEI